MYDLHSSFDIEQHKKHYVHYLEVMILEDGTIVYAVPSHQIRAEYLAAEANNIPHDVLVNSCPPEYYGDYLTWLLTQSGAIAVWENFVMTGLNGVTDAQVAALKQLKDAKLYFGLVPD